jgi:hypothetical protein
MRWVWSIGVAIIVVPILFFALLAGPYLFPMLWCDLSGHC